MIVRPPENQTVLENAEVKIPCEGEAEPANLTVRWYKDGIPVHKMGTLGQRTSVLSDGTLQIRLITSEDNGWYTCEITNGIGRSITERAYINVECNFEIVAKMYPDKDFSNSRSSKSCIHPNGPVHSPRFKRYHQMRDRRNPAHHLHHVEKRQPIIRPIQYCGNHGLAQRIIAYRSSKIDL